ncbi:MAG: hypothetical protein QG662_2348 [Pseudomonadota bacterium]|nr:hypothetical protein [Pseudomonadota bacterium]
MRRERRNAKARTRGSKAFHVDAFPGEQAGVQSGEQGLPPQQFSVRKASSAFIAANSAL